MSATRARAARAPASAWIEHLLGVSEQALEDLAVAECADVVFVRADAPDQATAFAESLEQRALARRFAVAQASVATDRAFDTLDALVRAVLRAMHAPGTQPARGDGLLGMLDAFARHHGRLAPARFDEQAASIAAAGDLVSLARAYVASAGQPRTEKRRLMAWVEGTELGHTEMASTAVSALTSRTAKRALTELTRLVRVLGYRGTLLVVRDGEVLARLPPARRETAYTVLRELVDNADGGRGLFATRLVVVGSAPLFEGARSMASLRPLATRTSTTGSTSQIAPPHRPLVSLTPPASIALPGVDVTAPKGADAAAVRALIRASQGVPPTESILSMTVARRAIDGTIDRLFAHSAVNGSVFALLTGDYGSGKTHLLLHLAARALAERRPVFRLSLERLDADLGNPQRHLRRMLEAATLPGSERATPIDRLLAWTRAPQSLATLVHTLEEIAERDDGDAARAAGRALRRARHPKTRAAALDAFLGGSDLATKSGAANYRADAYGRFLLWLDLLERLEHCAGPVVLIDEAENLYRAGSSRSERRTALRSLSFYCGGALPRACVVMAITPDLLASLRSEAKELLDELADQSTLLASEDATMLRRRLARLAPFEMPAMGPEHRTDLLARVRATHARVRGPIEEARWRRIADGILSDENTSPRELIRRATDALECAMLGV